MLIEYDWYYSSDDYFRVYDIYTDENNTIQINYTHKLEIKRDKTCRREKRRCKDYIRKESPDLKYAILQVTATGFSYTINMRYGKQEKYYPTTIYLSCGIAFALSLPNIILHILNKIYFKHENFNKMFLIMDICLHFGIFNIISK